MGTCFPVHWFFLLSIYRIQWTPPTLLLDKITVLVIGTKVVIVYVLTINDITVFMGKDIHYMVRARITQDLLEDLKAMVPAEQISTGKSVLDLHAKDESRHPAAGCAVL